MTPPFSTNLYRLQYWQGQVLRSRDLSDQPSYGALLQAWHNRAMHEAYGIVFGLEALLSGAEVTVQTGLAYNAYGQELLLVSERVLALPEEIPAGGLYLVIGQPESTGGDSCPPPWDVGGGKVILSLQMYQQMDTRRVIPLAHLRADRTLDPVFTPPRARPDARPQRFYSGTLRGATPWRLWELPDTSKDTIPMRKLYRERRERFLGIQVNVDARPAGFTETPCYFAWLSGSLYTPELPERVSQYFGSGSRSPFQRIISGVLLLQLLAMRFGHITDPTPNGFTFRLWLPQAAKYIPSRAIFSYILVLAQQGGLTLNWLGVQMNQAIGGL